MCVSPFTHPSAPLSGDVFTQYLSPTPTQKYIKRTQPKNSATTARQKLPLRRSSNSCAISRLQAVCTVLGRASAVSLGVEGSE